MTEIQQLIADAVDKLNPPTFYRLAKECGLKNVSNVYEWKNGTKKPNADHLMKIMAIANRKRQAGAALVYLLITIATSSGLFLKISAMCPLYTLYDALRRLRQTRHLPPTFAF